MRIDENGNVGMGTTIPSEKLTVVDAGNANQFQGTVSVLANNLTRGVGIGYGGIQAIGSLPDTPLNLNAKGTGNIIMQNDGTTGNVGIAVAVPLKKLDINVANDAIRLRSLLQTNTFNDDGTIRHLAYNNTNGDTTQRIDRQVQSVALNVNESATITDITGGVNGTLSIRTAVNGSSAGYNMMATFNYARRGLGLLGIAVDSATEATFTRTGAGAGVTYSIIASSVIGFTITKPTANTITITNTSNAARTFAVSVEPML